MFDSKKFPLAVGLFFTLLSAICGLLIWVVPNQFIAIIKPITHGTNWDIIWKPEMTLGSFVLGLIDAFVLSYVLAWIFAKIYQMLDKK
ncbi:MAG: hypothetical protein GYA31_02580 [Parcubacteria group bacterium]|nr:hypothetical protein [Parcubacteria group bacterium]